MTKEKRLGRGLEALLSRVSGAGEDPSGQPPADAIATPPDNAAAADADSMAHDAALVDEHLAPPVIEQPETPVDAQPSPPANTERDGLIELEIYKIDSNPFQPRRHFDEAEIDTLSESLRTHGLLQPIVVRRTDSRYQVVAGERRLRAATKAGWATMPARLVEADDRQMAEWAIIENMQRKDLGALEKAASFQRYIEQYGCTQEDLAGRLNLNRSTIANLIRLLELPESVQDSVRQNKITQGHARALLPLGDEPEQIAFCQRIQNEELSVRQTEQLVQETIEDGDARQPLGVVDRDGRSRRPKRVENEQISALEQEFRAALGTKVKITHSGRGRGRLVINFLNHDDFDRIRRHICEPGDPIIRADFG